MPEKNLVINNRIISYKGVFRIKEVFSTINNSLDQLGYQKQEKKTEESVDPSGRSTYIELRPFKVKSTYETLMIKIKIILNNVTEVTKRVDGIPKKFQQGDVNIIIDSWSLTNYVQRWGMKPFFYFLKGFVNKYIYHFPLEEGFIDELKSDTNYLTDQLKSLFSLYKYQVK